MGFSVSPVLWRRLVRAKSAGRVQSVALRLIVDREVEIEAHNAKPHWVVNARLAHADGTEFSAVLNTIDGRPLARHPLNEADAQAAATRIAAASIHVLDVATKGSIRTPPTAFTTSTMQQEASRRLGMSPATTMQAAQSLYEGGLDNGGCVLFWGPLSYSNCLFAALPQQRHLEKGLSHHRRGLGDICPDRQQHLEFRSCTTDSWLHSQDLWR